MVAFEPKTVSHSLVLHSLFRLPNIVAGDEVTSSEAKVLRSFSGENVAEIYHVTPSQLRKAKRVLFSDYSHVPIADILAVLRHAAQHIFTRFEEFATLSKLSGSPVSYLIESINDTKHWIMHTQQFLEGIFGCVDYHCQERSSLSRTTTTFLSPRGPAVVFFPSNDEVVPLFVFSQLLLARTPALIRTSVRHASNYSVSLFFKSLKTSAKTLGLESVSELLSSYSIVNFDRELSSEKKAEISPEDTILPFVVQGAQYVVFGSNETIESVTQVVHRHDSHATIIGLGTGFSVSFVLADAHLDDAAREIVHAAATDRGNKCTSTSVCYVDSSITEQFLASLRKHSQDYATGSPLTLQTKLGHLSDKYKQSLSTFFSEHHIEVKDVGSQLHLCNFSPEQRAREVPGPLLILKSLSGNDALLSSFLSDLKHNTLEKNLVSSVFTQNELVFSNFARKLPSHTIRHNISTLRHNLFAEHQGFYLVEALLSKRIIEGVRTEHLNTHEDKRSSGEKEVFYGSEARSLGHSRV